MISYEGGIPAEFTETTNNKFNKCKTKIDLSGNVLWTNTISDLILNETKKALKNDYVEINKKLMIIYGETYTHEEKKYGEFKLAKNNVPRELRLLYKINK